MEVPADLLRQAIEVTSEGVVITDAREDERPIVYVNPGFERLTGYRADEVLGKNCRFLQGNDRDQPERARLRRAIADGLPCAVVLRNYRKDGSLFWNELTLNPVRGASGRVEHVIGVLRDVTARIRLEKALQEAQKQLEQTREALSRQAARDALTEVTNRRAFLEHLEREWKRAARESTWVGLVLVDLDSFKDYNRRNGHLAGDECLRQVAGALERVLKRPGDVLARYGGEEFAALLPATDGAGSLLVGEAMRRAVSELGLTASVGVAAIVPTGSLAPKDLLARAESARERAQRQGGDTALPMEPGLETEVAPAR